MHFHRTVPSQIWPQDPKSRILPGNVAAGPDRGASRNMLGCLRVYRVTRAPVVWTLQALGLNTCTFAVYYFESVYCPMKKTKLTSTPW